MFCTNCGKELKDDAKFCFVCGTPVFDGTPEDAPASGVPEVEKIQFERGTTAMPKPPRKKKGWLAIVAVIAVVAVAVVALAASGLFGSPSVKVASALAKSAGAFSDVVDQMELTDLSDLVEGEKVSEELSVWINEIEGASMLQGMGVHMSVDSDLPGRNMGMTVTPYFGSADLVTLQMKFDDDEIYLGSPELTKGRFYMINTRTVMQDLENMGAGLGDAAQISFNIFDLIEETQELNKGNEEQTKAVVKAAGELVTEAEVEKADSETIDVNGTELKCTAYNVLITEEAMHTFMDTLKEAYSGMDNNEAYIQLMESIGMPREILDEMEYAMEETAPATDDMFNELHDVVAELGDVQLKLYLNDGYVVAAVYENSFDGTNVEMILNIGGGENYVDDVSLVLTADDEGYRIVSSGDHGGDVFTDETVIEFVHLNSSYTLMEMSTSYAPKATSDNLTFCINSDSVSIELEGQLTCKKDSMTLRLDDFAVSEYGSKLMDIGMEMTIGKYQGDNISTVDYIAFAGMTEDDLMAEAQVLGQNASDWLMNLDADFQNLLGGLMYGGF